MGAPISQGGPQNVNILGPHGAPNVKILGPQGPRILTFWGPQNRGALFSHDTGLKGLTVLYCSLFVFTVDWIILFYIDLAIVCLCICIVCVLQDSQVD